MKNQTDVPTALKKRPMAKDIPGQKLPYPAKQSEMNPMPQTDFSHYKSAGKLEEKVALITGADSGIGRAVAIAFALEGAKVAIFYNENDEDADMTRSLIEKNDGRCLVIKGDVRNAKECQEAVQKVIDTYDHLNILVNNAAYQMAQERFEDVTDEQLRRTFETNIFGYFYMAKATLPHLKSGDTIINTGSIVGLVGNPLLIDYTATKGAIHAFTKSLALYLGERNIRVNAVIPGPVWTPNIPGTMPINEVKNFGHEVALARPGQPDICRAPAVKISAELRQ